MEIPIKMDDLETSKYLLRCLDVGRFDFHNLYHQPHPTYSIEQNLESYKAGPENDRFENGVIVKTPYKCPKIYK